MSKIANMLNMVTLLEDGKVHSLLEISQKLEVSTRMIRCYKQELEQAGIYIKTIKGLHGGYALDGALNHIDVGLTENELTILNLVQEENALKENFLYKKEYISIIEKINGNYGKNKKKQDLKGLQQIMSIHPNLESLYKEMRNAITSQNKVWIQYYSVHSHITERVIHPAELFDYCKESYVAAFCEKRNEIRLFKLANILDYKILQENYLEKIPLKKDK